MSFMDLKQHIIQRKHQKHGFSAHYLSFLWLLYTMYFNFYLEAQQDVRPLYQVKVQVRRPPKHKHLSFQRCWSSRWRHKAHGIMENSIIPCEFARLQSRFANFWLQAVQVGGIAVSNPGYQYHSTSIYGCQNMPIFVIVLRAIVYICTPLW